MGALLRPSTAAVLVAGLMLSGACGSDSAEETEAPATSPATGDTATTAIANPAPPTTPATTAAAASCDVAAIRPVVVDLFPENDAWKIVDVEVSECQNGYARVWAIPDQSGCSEEYPNCLETEQVFLQDVDGEWTYLTSGTGIECPDPFIADACEALGLP
jgi:hypothetical protein